MRSFVVQSVARYLWQAQTIYDVHAPLAFAFLGEVIEDDRHFYAYDLIERRRRQLQRDRTRLDIVDHGAGSLAGEGRAKTVGRLARHSATPPRFGRYLHKSVDFLGAARVLELGTNLGIGTAYLASALPAGGSLISIDAEPAVLVHARDTLAAAAPCAQVDLREGTFAEQLDGALADLGVVDLAFIDGHHAEQPTVNYFRSIASRCTSQSLIIIDDIHWSPGMESAWQTIKMEPSVTLTIDLQRFGVAFFNDAVKQAQHLVIAPSHFKPWHMGFFSAPSTQTG